MRYSIIATTIALTAVSAQAADFTTRDDLFFEPYIGADYQYSHFTDTPTGIENNYSGGDVHIGARLHKYLGVEAGYFMTETGEDDSSGLNVESKFRGANIDLMGYAPLTDQFELIGSVGANYTKGEVDVAGLGGAEGDDWDVRYGAGAQYWLGDNVNTRIMVHYTDDPDASDMVTGSVGLNVQF